MPAPHNQGKAWTQGDKDEVVNLHLLGMANYTIGNYLGRSEFAIECKLRELGYDPDNTPPKRYNPCKEIIMRDEPTLGQLQLREVLMDMKKGEVVVVRGLHTGNEYHITSCEPFVGVGVVTLVNPESGDEYKERMTDVLNYMELMDVDLTQEYMVSVDGMQAPRKVHDSYKDACDEADRLARKHIGNRVRVLKVEHVIRAKQHVEVEECL